MRRLVDAGWAVALAAAMAGCGAGPEPCKELKGADGPLLFEGDAAFGGRLGLREARIVRDRERRMFRIRLGNSGATALAFAFEVRYAGADGLSVEAFPRRYPIRLGPGREVVVQDECGIPASVGADRIGIRIVPDGR